MKIARVIFEGYEYLVTPADKNRVQVIDGDIFTNTLLSTNTFFNLSDIRFLPPTNPSKIVAAGLNYKDHAREMKMNVPCEPCIFLKAPTSIIAHNEAIVIPKNAGRIDFEAELAFIVKKEAKNIREEEAKEYILGYTCLNDVTARELQTKDGQWTRAKSFDTFCPVGPWIETELQTRELNVRLYLNDEIKQDSNTREFIFSPEKILSFVSSVMTLLPGDIISTGTPSGIGPMKAGDRVCVEIEGIAKLENPVV